MINTIKNFDLFFNVAIFQKINVQRTGQGGLKTSVGREYCTYPHDSVHV